MTDSVSQFCLLHGIQLPHLKADDYRMVQPGTYTHTSLPLGSSRDGITNGIVAYFIFDNKVQHVQLLNLSVVLDKKPSYCKPKGINNAKTSPKPRKSREDRIREMYGVIL